ncbi:CUB domain protein, partial [Cooperia oncophora]
LNIEPARRCTAMWTGAVLSSMRRNNFHCSYLLKGRSGQRVKLFFRDFDIFFGGEHCPYDSVTIFDGSSTSSPIIKKVCGLQQRMELFSVGTDLLIHFNTTNPAKADPRGYVQSAELFKKLIGDTIRDEQRTTSQWWSHC